MNYEIDDKIGRADSRDRVAITAMSVTTIAGSLPVDPLGRRNYIKVKNMDNTNNVAILTVSGIYADGFPVLKDGGEWEDNTDAGFYIVSESGIVNVRVYERAERFNYKK